MPELALHGGIARRLLRPVLLYSAFTAVLVIGKSIQIGRVGFLSQVMECRSCSRARKRISPVQ